MKLISLPNPDHRGSGLSKLKAFMGIGLFLFLFGQSTYSQETRISSGSSSIATFGGKIENNTKITEIAYEKKVIGSFYFDPEWKNSDVYIVRDSMILKDLETRLDLRNNMLEIKYKGEIKTLPSYRIRSVFYHDAKSLFVTETVLKSSIQGFYKVLVDDENSLLCKYDTKVKRSSYNVILDTGSRDDQIVKEMCYYLYNNLKLIKLENTKTKLKKQFESRSDFNTYLISHKTNPKKEYSLVQFINYLNKQKIQL